MCAECGEGNAVGRKFCRKCGNSLVAVVAAPEPAPPPPSGLKKLTTKQEAAPLAAGERPVVKASQGRTRKLVIIAAVLVAGVGAGLFGMLGSAKDKISPSDFVAVAPVSAQATSQAPDAPAGNTIDGAPNTWWSEAAPGNGVGQSVTVTLDKAYDIEKVGLFPGQDAETFLKNPRPSKVRVDLLGESGAVIASKELSLADNKTSIQIFDAGGQGVKAVKIEILDVYPGQAGGTDAASITDLQFFTKG
jgi:hypothetical protein